MRAVNVSKNIADWAWKYVPLAGVMTMASYVLAKEILAPTGRTVKVLVLFLVLVILLRFEMVFSLYMFVVLFPFPSGIALTSTNVVFLTLIALLWVVRAHSANIPLFTRTDLDKYIWFYLAAFIVSFFNVEPGYFAQSLKLLWLELAVIAYCYLIVRFVDDENKLATFTRLIAVSSGLLALTGLLQLVAPTSDLIPGWINVRSPGELGQRVEGVRLTGAVASHSVLSDYSVIGMFFMTLHLIRTRNPITRTVWLGMLAMTFFVTLATGNRGAFLSMLIGILYSGYVFRRHLSLGRVIIVGSLFMALLIGAEIAIRKHSYAVSVTQRVTETTFEKGIPNNRAGAWIPALKGSLDHIFIGHGPYYDTGTGLDKKAWPHNSYIFVLYTFGIFGLIAFLLVRYKLFRISLAYRSPAAQGTFTGTVLAICNILLLVRLAAIGRTDFQRPADYVSVFFVWMIFGLTLACANIVKERKAKLARNTVSAP
ncbi:MAG: O-antigen ligase family protein [bacterium]|nr:O-antigen ligase family protein [bacterium]